MMSISSTTTRQAAGVSNPARILVVAVFVIAVLGSIAPSSVAIASVPEPQDDGVNVPTFSAPTVDLDRTEVREGDSVRVTIAGFSSISVTTTICGNQGLRGSSDCYVAGAESVETNRNNVSDISFIINNPPVPCPCVIRVASPNNDEVAIADIQVLGHPIAELEAGSVFVQPLSAELVAEPRAAGPVTWVKSSLGGATTYDVRLTIRNRSQRPVERVAVDGEVGRGGDDVRSQIDFPQPGLIEANGTWEQVIQVDLPAPVYGNAAWRVSIASENPTIAVTETTSHLPGLFLLAIALLVADLIFILVRMVNRRRRRARDARAESDSEDAPLEPADRSLLDPVLMEL